MRNVYIYLSLLLLLCAKGRGQGSDIVFLVDNSSSISNAEYTQMQGSIASLMGEVLECNDENTISVVQYSQVFGGTPRIFIQSDFTSTAYTFTRAYNDIGNIPASVDLLSNALSAAPAAAGITSMQKKLNRTPGNELVVYLFTDAPRNNDLVTGAGAGNPAFASYTNFKNTYGATFIVTLVLTPGDITAAPAAASIASVGGSYNSPNPIEGYPLDPDGSTTLPRFLLVKTDFNLSPAEIEIVTDDICSVAVPPCEPILTLTTPGGDDVSATDTRQTEILIDASNRIFTGGVGIYHSEQTIVLTPGFHSANGSRFRAYIDGCNTGYVGRPGAEEIEEVSTQQARLFSLSPNPASESVQISSSEGIQSLSVTSFEGKVIFNKNLNGKNNSFEIYVRDYINGFYTITVTTVDGKVETQKLIKN